MSMREILTEYLTSCRDGMVLEDYSEADEEIRFQLPSLPRDPQTEEFRSAAAILNAFAVSHRLSLLAWRHKYRPPAGSVVVMKSIESAADGLAFAPACAIVLRLDAVSDRRGRMKSFRSTVNARSGAAARTTTALFDVIPPLLVKFLSRERQLVDPSDLGMSRRQPVLARIGDRRFRYCPFEETPHSGGKPADHVPALTLIDLALFCNSSIDPGAVYRNVSAEFLDYADPRTALEVALRPDSGAVDFVQRDRVVATVTVA